MCLFLSVHLLIDQRTRDKSRQLNSIRVTEFYKTTLLSSPLDTGFLHMVPQLRKFVTHLNRVIP